ncbi:acetate--CoA ligase [Caldisphaera lagunensis]|nr:acetate--CoA ligase [Caldisphaera lagunensis]
MQTFKELWKKAYENPEDFWNNKANESEEDIYWFKKWDKTFKWEYPKFSWFINGKTNISYNCLDYKVKRYGTKIAYIYEAPEYNQSYSITYSQLYYMVKDYAASLRKAGINKGDRVLIYLPNSIEAIAMILASARIGAISVTVFAGFSPGAIADRIELTRPKLIFTQDYASRRGKLIGLNDYIEEALKLVSKEVSENIKYIIVRRMMPELEIRMKEGRDLLIKEFLNMGKGESSDYVEMDADDPIFIMPTSGTTAKPKPVVHVHGGYQIWNYWAAKWIYGLEPNDIILNTSDIGWIVGQSYIVFGPLLAGSTTIVYDGVPDYPEPGMWWKIMEKNRATLLWTSPTGARTLRRFGTEKAKEFDLSSLKRVVAAGEVLNPEVWNWLYKDVFDERIPVIDHMWQTETTGALFGYPYGIGGDEIKKYVKPGSAGLPLPGVIPVIIDEVTGKEASPNQKGILYLKRPFPGLTPRLWGDFDRYVKSYWEVGFGKGYYFTGDAAMMDENGFLWFSGRSDEVMKIAGHRIGTIEVENALISHPAVAEAGVTGVPDELRGEVIAAFVVLKQGYKPSEELKKELIEHVRKTFGPVAVFKDIEFVNMLPKTRSGKIMRRVMKRLFLGQDIGDVSTLEEEASINEIKEAIEKFKKLSIQ